MLYACDFRWWRAYEGAPEFQGLKVTEDARVPPAFPDVHRIPSVAQEGLSLDPLVIHQGANGGYQALNLAVLLGAKRIILLGYDIQATDSRRHWHGDHPRGMNNPHEDLFACWRKCFDTTVDDLHCAGIEVVNASRETALDCFPRARLGDVL